MNHKQKESKNPPSNPEGKDPGTWFAARGSTAMSSFRNYMLIFGPPKDSARLRSMSDQSWAWDGLGRIDVSAWSEVLTPVWTSAVTIPGRLHGSSVRRLIAKTGGDQMIAQVASARCQPGSRTAVISRKPSSATSDLSTTNSELSVDQPFMVLPSTCGVPDIASVTNRWLVMAPSPRSGSCQLSPLMLQPLRQHDFPFRVRVELVDILFTSGQIVAVSPMYHGRRDSALSRQLIERAECGEHSLSAKAGRTDLDLGLEPFGSMVAPPSLSPSVLNGCLD